MRTPVPEAKKNTALRWLVRPKGREEMVVSIRGIGWLSLLKLLTIGYAFGSFPYIVLLNFAAFTQPGALNGEAKNAILFPRILVSWPVLSLCAAWFTTLFVYVGLKIFGAIRPMRITVLVDEKKEKP
jgi:hypothetical protein